MVNMLIAIMGDSYEHVMENIKLEGIRARALVCADLLMDTRASNKKYFPRWLHVCTPDGQKEETDLWQGRLKAVKEEVKKAKFSMEEKVEAVTSKLQATEQKQKQMHETLKKIMALLQESQNRSSKKMSSDQKK